MFLDEVIGTLERATEEGISTDNLVLEVNSLKYVSTIIYFGVFIYIYIISFFKGGSP